MSNKTEVLELSLRDYMAGIALLGLLAKYGCSDPAIGGDTGISCEEQTRDAYRLADAMLKERSNVPA